MKIKGVLHFTESQYLHIGWEVKQILAHTKVDVNHLDILMKGVEEHKQGEEGCAYVIPVLNMIRFVEACTGQEYVLFYSEQEGDRYPEKFNFLNKVKV